MTSHEYLMSCRVGKVQPYMVVYNYIVRDEKIKRLQQNAGSGPQQKNGFLFPEEQRFVEDALRTFHVTFEPKTDPVTTEEYHTKKISTVLDIPLSQITEADNNFRLLFISSELDPKEVIQEYLATIGASSHNIRSFPCDGQMLKKVFQNEVIYSTIHQIKSSQRNLKFHYHGTKTIASPSDDVRLDPDFEHILREEWKTIRLKLKRLSNGHAGPPPKVQISSDGYIRLWSKWLSQGIILYLISLVKAMLNVQHDTIDEDKLYEIFEKMQKSRQFTLESFSKK